MTMSGMEEHEEKDRDREHQQLRHAVGIGQWQAKQEGKM